MQRLQLPVGRIPDEALLAGLATGDPELAVTFVRRFQHMVFGVALAVTRDAQLAEDISQQTFERAWRHAQIYDSRRGSVTTWMTTIAHNLAIDAVRARRPEPVAPEDLDALLEVVTDTPEQRALADEASSTLRAAVARLPREQGRALVMAGIYGMTAQQIADREHIPLGTAKTRIRTAMGKLRTTLAAANPATGNPATGNPASANAAAGNPASANAASANGASANGVSAHSASAHSASVNPQSPPSPKSSPNCKSPNPASPKRGDHV